MEDRNLFKDKTNTTNTRSAEKAKKKPSTPKVKKDKKKKMEAKKKGETKQIVWVNQVDRAIEAVKDNQMKDLLQKIQGFGNLPRKEAKFINFLVISNNIRDRDLCSRAWAALAEETAKIEKEKEEAKKAAKEMKKKEETKKKMKERKEEKKVWMGQVDRAIEAAKDQQLKDLLQKIQGFATISRKEAKFINFLVNSNNSPDLCSRAWAAIAEEAAKIKKEEEKKQPKLKPVPTAEKAEKKPSTPKDTKDVKKDKKKEGANVKKQQPLQPLQQPKLKPVRTAGKKPSTPKDTKEVKKDKKKHQKQFPLSAFFTSAAKKAKKKLSTPKDTNVMKKGKKEKKEEAKEKLPQLQFGIFIVDTTQCSLLTTAIKPLKPMRSYLGRKRQRKYVPTKPLKPIGPCMYWNKVDPVQYELYESGIIPI